VIDSVGATRDDRPLGSEPIDAAFAYLRHRWLRVVPLYVVAMVPATAVAMMAIDIVTSEYRSAVPTCAGLAVAATVWRWLWLPSIQERVRADVTGQDPQAIAPRLGHIFVLRLIAAFAMSWGGTLIIPAYYGWYLSSFAANLAVENRGSLWSKLRSSITWTHTAGRRLRRVFLGVFVLGILVTLSTFVFVQLMVKMVLPGFFGIDASNLALTIDSSAGLLCLGVLVCLVLDLYWSIVAVMVYQDVQARRLGTDLSLRLASLQEQRP
jgi:hypothetical protein